MQSPYKVKFHVEEHTGHHGEVLSDAYDDETVVDAEDGIDAWNQVDASDRTLISVALDWPEMPALEHPA